MKVGVGTGLAGLFPSVTLISRQSERLSMHCLQNVLNVPDSSLHQPKIVLLRFPRGRISAACIWQGHKRLQADPSDYQLPGIGAIISSFGLFPNKSLKGAKVVPKIVPKKVSQLLRKKRVPPFWLNA